MPLTPAFVLRRLAREHGPLDAPPERDPLDELVLTILSQNTSDVNRDRAWASLRARWPTWEDVEAAPTGEVEAAIRVGGLAATKAPRIQSVLRGIRERTGSLDLSSLRSLGDEDAEGFLAALPGVGPKTAACVLAFALGRPAIPVDTHVHRLARRMGLIDQGVDAGRAHAALRAAVQPRHRLPLHVALVRHGRRVCRAQRPLCESCALARWCPRIGL